MTEGEKKFTQEDLDKIVQERLARERAKFADYDEIKAENASLKAENTDLKAKVADQDGKLRESEIQAQKAEIAKKAGLPDALSSRIRGETEEELLTDAKRLAEAMGPGPKVGDGTNPPTGQKKPLTRADIKRMKPEEIAANWPQIRSQLKDGSLNRV